ncbi:MAG: thermonuclease family protein [Treponema sp.]|jgi:micrococcal nuclease|nr:thermonuclease family protein [Treponema sp.]
MNRIRFMLGMVFMLVGVLLFPGAEDATVYVTNSGQKYHNDGCSSLARSKIAVTLGDAVRSGYEPCSVCKPPVFVAGTGGATPVSAQPEGLYRVNTAHLTKTTEAALSRMVKAEVVGHVDGDTVRVRIPNPPKDLGTVETIRMIGVDTPETVHPKRPVEYFGIEASNFTKERLLNRQVYLAFDWDLRDRYGRLLAYIYTEDGQCFNASLVREGYGHAYISYAFQFIEEFKNLEADAKNKKRGLWSNIE